MEEEKSFKYVIIGASLSAGYAAIEFVNQGLKLNEVAIISNESVPPVLDLEAKSFDSITSLPLNSLLSKDYVRARTRGDRHCIDWYKEKGIVLILSTEIIQADLSAKKLISNDGKIFKYQTLLIATGFTFLRFSGLGVQDAYPKNVFYIRDMKDVRETKKKTKAIIIGGGYMEFELSATLTDKNYNVTMIFPEPWILHQLFTAEIALFYESYYTEKGIKIIKSNVATGFNTNSNGEVTEVKLEDGRTLEADIVIVGVGGKPMTSLFNGQVEEEMDGIKTDGFFKTSVHDVYAIGDVATFPTKLYGDLRRVEHLDHARRSAQHAVKVGIKNPENPLVMMLGLGPYQHFKASMVGTLKRSCSLNF